MLFKRIAVNFLFLYSAGMFSSILSGGLVWASKLSIVFLSAVNRVGMLVSETIHVDVSVRSLVSLVPSFASTTVMRNLS